MAGAGGGATLDCPRCGTTYRLSGAHGARGEATYECAKCHEVFGPGTAGDDTWRDESDEETFTFDDEAPTPPRAASGRARRAKAAAREQRGPVELEVEDVEIEDVDIDEDEEDVALDEDEEPTFTAPPKPRRRRAEASTDDEPASPGVARFALRALIAVTLSYAVISVWASTHLDTFQHLLGRIPVVGSGLAESSLDPSDVALRDVQGAYDYLKSGELAFVVRGTAANLSSDSLRRVRVEGRVSGAEEQRQLASCTDAPTDVRKMSRQMLMLMENVRETRPAVVPAGGSAACEVVFVDPPHPIHELSLEVISVLAD